MWTSCKSNHSWCVEITFLGYNSPGISPVYFILKCHITPTQVPRMYTRQDSCCWALWWRKRTQCRYPFHAQRDLLLWMIAAAHRVILLSESLLSPARPISAGLSCWTSSYWAKDRNGERRDWAQTLAKERDGSEGETHGRRMNERMTGRVRERICRANKKHRDGVMDLTE